jgi:hypothetical protein
MAEKIMCLRVDTQHVLDAFCFYILLRTDRELSENDIFKDYYVAIFAYDA